MKITQKIITLAAVSVACAASAFSQIIVTAVPVSTPASPGNSEDAAALRAEIREMYDANRDGRIDRWERVVLHRDVEAGDIPAPPRRAASGKFRAFRGEILAMYDASGDGRLDEWERLILERDIEAGDITPPAHGGATLANRGT